MAETRTEREKLVEALERIEDLTAPDCEEALDPETVVEVWEISRRALAAADLLSEQGEPVAWEAETTEGGWWRYNATRRWTEQMVSGNSMFTGRIRALYAGPVEDVR